MTIAARPALVLPAPTTDVDQARQDLTRTGLCVVRDVLTDEALEVSSAPAAGQAADARLLADPGRIPDPPSAAPFEEMDR